MTDSVHRPLRCDGSKVSNLLEKIARNYIKSSLESGKKLSYLSYISYPSYMSFFHNPSARNYINSSLESGLQISGLSYTS